MTRKLSILIFFVSILFAGTARAQDSGRNQFLGVGGTLGVPMGWTTVDGATCHNYGLTAGTGLDWAHPVADRFAVGMYFTLGIGPNFFKDPTPPNEVGQNIAVNFRAGILMLVGDVNKNPFIIGLAPLTGLVVDGNTAPYDFMGSPLEVRFGRLLNKNLYITGNLTWFCPTLVYGLVEPEKDFNYFFFEPSITLGFNFGPRLKKIRR